ERGAVLAEDHAAEHAVVVLLIAGDEEVGAAVVGDHVREEPAADAGVAPGEGGPEGGAALEVPVDEQVGADVLGGGDAQERVEIPGRLEGGAGAGGVLDAQVAERDGLGVAAEAGPIEER